MAPTKKKKKAAVNPARGFTTVSLPSKASAARQEDTTPEPQESITGGQSTDEFVKSKCLTASQSEHVTIALQDPDIQNMSLEELDQHFRDSEIQSILDSHGSRCKAEASRQVARLEVERRMLRLQSAKVSCNSGLSEIAVDEILKVSYMSIESHLHVLTTSRRPAVPKFETDLLLQIWTLQRVLSKLNFPRIDEALVHILNLASVGHILPSKEDIWGLAEVLDWYALHAAECNFPNYDYSFPKSRRDWDVRKSTDSNDEKTDSDMQSSDTDQQNGNTNPAKSSKALAALDDRIVMTGTGSYHHNVDGTDPESISGSEEEDDDPSKLVSRYISLRSTLLALQEDQGKPNSLPRQKQRLNDRLARIENDILFDHDAADTAWRDLQPKLLRDLAKRRQANNTEAAAERQATKIEGPSAEEVSDEQNEEMGLDDIFNEDHPLDDNAQQSQDASENCIDFGTWAGVPPRRLLEEQCTLFDGRCQVSLKLISKSSHAFCQRLTIKWSSEQPYDPFISESLPLSVTHSLSAYSTELSMRSISTPTKIQSEAYICSLALFIVVAARDDRSQKIFLRLPLVWRDLVSDLAESRTRAIEKFDKSELIRLKSLIHEFERKVPIGSLAPTTEPQRNRHVEAGGNQADAKLAKRFDADRAKFEWTRRASSTNYNSLLPIRKDLPIYGHKTQILETVTGEKITILCAETGAGKSTQVPAYILEHELSSGRDCHILVTQPRRISAISLARRVSQELGEAAHALGSRDSLVGYAIRMESKTSSSTRITFATSGVLLRMLENSPDLDEIDCVILDEVHERTMDLDLLFIALRRLVERRPTMKLVLMSATVDAQKLSDYFGGAPMLDIAGRTHPVEIRFLEDAVEATINHLSISKSKFQPTVEADGNDSEDIRGTAPKGDLQGYSSTTQAFLADFNEHRIDYDLVAKLAYVISTQQAYTRYSAAILIFMPGLGEIRRLYNLLTSDKAFESGWVIHLLHSTLSTEELSRAFQPPPKSHRKIVIATNIAETGITIPDVTAVIDTCKEKVMRFDERRQVSRLIEGFISRASSRQRRGRAARVQPGLCFHLVTRYRFDNLMPERHVPEMLRLSLQEPILRIKIWGLGEIEETLAAAIDPPTRKNVVRAVEALKEVGALTKTEKLTLLGRRLAPLPLDVELGKLCILGIILKCLDAAVTITAVLLSKSPFQPNRAERRSASNQKPVGRDDEFDLWSTYALYQGWKRAKKAGTAAEFCRKEWLNEANLRDVETQKTAVLVSLVEARLVSLDDDERSALNVARFRSTQAFFEVPDRYQESSSSPDAVRAVTAMAFYPKLLSREGKTWRNVSTNQHVNIMRKATIGTGTGLPRWLSFYQAMQSKSGHLNVQGTSAVPESAVCLLLGEAEFRTYSGVIKIDGSRIQIATRDWRSLLAMKVLRREISSIISRFLREPSAKCTEREEKWFHTWLGAQSTG